MNKNIRDRVLMIGLYIESTKETIRETATVFGISKSSVHLDVSKRLKKIDFSLYENVKKILENNFNQKHIRGGESTRKKYLKNK